MRTSSANTAEGTFRELLRAYGLIRQAMHPFFARFGLSGAQWGTLRVLHRAEQEGLAHLRLTDLSGRLLIRPPSVTGVVDRLERMGLVERSSSQADHRSKQVSLTSAGRDLVERMLVGHASQVEAVLSGLGPQEQASLQRLLDRLSSHVRTLAGQKEGIAAQ
jgi:DNA-binding MarR family transcriptional regulator